MDGPGRAPGGSAGPVKRGTGDRREEILRAAGELLLEVGVVAFSMRRLARRLGMTAPALYRYFDDREQLLTAVLESCFELFELYLARGLTGQTPHERISLLVRGYLDFALDHPRAYALIFLPPGAFGVEELPARIRSRVARSVRLWVDRVREAMAAGWIIQSDPRSVALSLSALAHGLVVQRTRGLAPREREAFERFFWKGGLLVFEGLGGPTYSRDALPAFAREGVGE